MTQINAYLKFNGNCRGRRGQHITSKEKFLGRWPSSAGLATGSLQRLGLI